MRINYKVILISIGLFLSGLVLSFIFEEYYKQFIRLLFTRFNEGQIKYFGKNFHFFPSHKFLYSFCFYCLLIYLTPILLGLTKIIKSYLIALLSFFVTTILIALADSKRLVIGCANCIDEIKMLSYNSINYDLYFILSLIISFMIFLLLNKGTKEVSSPESQIDELIGIWTKEDDGSGLIAIFGWSYEFKSNNTGIYHFWEGSKKHNHSFEFEWQRINSNSIKIRENQNPKRETLKYQVQNVIGAYNTKQIKLTENDKNEFWNSTESLFKRQ